MKSIDYFFADKEQWDKGPWIDEPDKRQWTDEATGLPCLVVRGPLGALCGYVGVSKTHPLFEKHYDDAGVEVHGGLTFSSKCSEEENGICHKVEPGEDDDIWWFGFDCSHIYDLAPKMLSNRRLFRDKGKFDETWPRAFQVTPPWKETYKDFAYVKAECEKLARQLKDIDGDAG